MMNNTEFKTKLTQIHDHISEIERLTTEIANEMAERGYDEDAEDFCTDVSDWFPSFPKTDYVPLTLDDVCNNYADIFDATV